MFYLDTVMTNKHNIQGEKVQNSITKIPAQFSISVHASILFTLINNEVLIKLSTIYNKPQLVIFPTLLQLTLYLKNWMSSFSVHRITEL